VYEGLEITQERAEELLRLDLRRFEDAVRMQVAVELTQNQFDALVSLVYNIGEGAFSKSTLLRKLNAGDYAGAQAQFAVWRKAGGKVMPGLVNRRAQEAALFGRGEYVSSNTVEPDVPPSPRVTSAAQATGATSTAVGTTAAALQEQGLILSGQGGDTVRLIALILTLAGVALLLWSVLRRNRE
jgi:hypothetical protein